MPITKQYKPLSAAEQQQRTRERWAWQQQQQAAFEASRAARQAEDAAFMQRVQASREARAAAIERGEELPPAAIPTFEAIMAEKREAEKAAAAAAEAARIAAITPAQQKRMQLSWSEQQRRAKFEAVNPGLTWIED